MTASEQQIEFLPLDTTDVDRWIGVPVGGTQPKEPFSANDIRRFAQGMDNPHRLYWDDEYARASPFGGIVAPQSYFGGGPGTGATPAIQGVIPGSHMLFGGDEQWFYGPRIYPGDRIRLDRMLFDYRVTETRFAGPTMFSRGDTTYVNDRGEYIAKQRSTAIRYLVENALKLRSLLDDRAEPDWSDADLECIAEEKLAWVASFPGHAKRLWRDVDVGDQMTRRPIGPHSVQTFTSESRTEQGPHAWGAYDWGPAAYPSSTMRSGWLPVMSRDESKAGADPSFADGLVYGASRGHVQPKYANVIGMPRGYGYGATMCAWVVDYVTNWAGDWGFLRHHRTQFRNPALTGNVTYLTGEVTRKWIDDEFGCAFVELTYEMATHEGTQMAKGVAEVELPQSEDDDSTLAIDPRYASRKAASS